MKAFQPGARQVVRRAKQHTGPSDELRIAVTFRGSGAEGLTRLHARPSSAAMSFLAPGALEVDRALHELGQRGFRLTSRGKMAASIRGPRALFERTFGTDLRRVDLDRSQHYACHSLWYPPPSARWEPDAALMALIDDAYIQWPHLYLAAAKPPATRPPAPKRPPRKQAEPADRPPPIPYWHLEVPVDVPRLLRASEVHRLGTTGRGVRVAMVDSGFAHSHPWFKRQGFGSTVVLAPGASHRETDKNGHGTGESANVFSVAPGATFIGVKVDNDADPGAGASMLEGFQEALRHRPHVISISMGYDLRDPKNPRAQLTALPNGLKALEAEIQAAIADGVVVVFSAGNGHYSFPGQMPEVISAGGTFVEQGGVLQASDYASAFPSRIYPGRGVPDFCGLVGLLPHADYIALPIPPGSEIDVENAAHDGTGKSDGWGVFSGTSAAAPQLAGVCALLLEKAPGLKPAQMKALLQHTARDVRVGHANPASDQAGKGVPAGPGRDGATGAGLVDALAAFHQL
jgi:hypothetical protein